MSDEFKGLLNNLTTNQIVQLAAQLQSSLAQQGVQQNAQRDVNNVFGLQQIFNQISVSNDQLLQLTQMLGIQDNLKYTVSRPSIEVPPLIKRSCKRAAIVDSITQELKSKTWYAIQGDIGCGKTQLAILVAREIGVCKAWISLRNLSSQQAAVTIDQVLQGLYQQSEVYLEFWSNLKPGDLVVLDDIYLLGSQQIDERVVVLVKECIARNVKLITTSYRKIPLIYHEIFETELVEFEVPRFSEAEVRELFLAYDAPNTIGDNFVLWCLTATKGHPALLNALARFLLSKKWNIAFDEFIRIIQGEFGEELSLEIDEVLKLEANETRDLLYRLALIDWPFNNEFVWGVSQVIPPIPRPIEVFLSSVGLWVQIDQRSEYMISPLLSKFGKKYLEPTIKGQVHLAIAKSILRKKHLSLLDVLRAINNFHLAGAESEVAHVLLKALIELNNHPVEVEDWGLPLIWADRELPNEIDYMLKISLRLIQVIVLKKRNKDYSFVLADFQKLVGEAKEIDVALIGVCIMASITLILEKPANALYFLKLSMIAARKYDYKKVFGLKSDLSIEIMLWMTPYKIQTSGDLQAWMDVLEIMTVEQRKTAFESDISLEGCMMAANSIWFTEHKKKPEDQSWELVLETTNKLIEFSKKINCEFLWACAIRAHSIVIAEYLNDVDRAVALVTNELSNASDDSAVQFVLNEAIGRQYAIAKRFEEAMPWFERAFSLPFDGLKHERLDAALLASRSLGNLDSSKGVHYSEISLQIAQNIPYKTMLYKAKILGELAIARWLDNDLKGGFLPLQDAAAILLKEKDGTDEWKSLFVIFGHITRYLSSIAASGSPPRNTLDGQEYIAPKRGMMFLEHPERHTLYKSQDWVQAMQLGRMADGLGFHKYAGYWMQHGYDLAQREGYNPTYSVFLLEALSYLITDKKFNEAIRLSLEALTWMAILQKNSSHDESDFNTTINIQDFMGSKPNDEWDRVEERVVLLCVFPLTVYLGSEWIKGNTDVPKYAQDIMSICQYVNP